VAEGMIVNRNIKSKAGLYALGRLKTGELNKTEQAYESMLKTMHITGEILWYKFEGIKLRLADNTFLTVDFAVMNKDRVIELVDVKGAKAVFMDDSKAKIKIAASMYPFIFKVAYPRLKKDGGGWDIEVFE
jgi:hypothetical protein